MAEAEKEADTGLNGEAPNDVVVLSVGRRFRGSLEKTRPIVMPTA